jgi:hypothetical protein
LHLVLDATGALQIDGRGPEKTEQLTTHPRASSRTLAGLY